MRSRNTRLRTVDVARRVGCSVQHVRDLEQAGVLPPAERTDSGYRTYTERHVQAALAYRALASGAGPAAARQMLGAAHRGRFDGLLAQLDAAHAALDTERHELELAVRAARAIDAEPIEQVRSSDSMGLSELAHALGVRPSTLRHWEAEGLLVPARAPGHSYRSYPPDVVRDARVVHQLRRAGYGIAALQTLLPQLRRAHRWEDLSTALAQRQANIDQRSRALLRGGAALDAILDPAPGHSDQPPPPAQRPD
jgi:DNA-binding transcriptional MerR regulator